MNWNKLQQKCPDGFQINCLLTSVFSETFQIDSNLKSNPFQKDITMIVDKT